MDNNTTYGYWRVVARHCRYTIPEDFARPAYIGEVKCPEDLSALTIGQLIEIGEANGTDADYRIVSIVLDMDKAQTDNCRATDVVSFLSWAGRQVKRINRLFEQVQTKPTAKEKQAGVDSLQFGLFGILDWYAKRMGITNHDDVLGVPWLRIYKCMDMDNKVERFQRRYNDISMQEARRKKR